METQQITIPPITDSDMRAVYTLACSSTDDETDAQIKSMLQSPIFAALCAEVMTNLIAPSETIFTISEAEAKRLTIPILAGFQICLRAGYALGWRDATERPA